ncbi:MAG: 4-hydroxy-3-methylbut-2-enyl diphosphate reductase [Bacilli bacterium]|jgi:4-hydroxy-3-methylbut-2-enyl diphosphate reductase|nr:4-hydroxy-3-methylbut-2-enyl diphosphate reductase [Bacilli bacterium]
MKIIKITPQGFCKGVIRAIALINKALLDPTIPRPIYMLGGLVHNKHIIQSYQDAGIQVISSIDSIDQGTVIITAHGISDAVLEAIHEKKLHVINATCFDVLKTHDLIKTKINEGYTILYYGKATHPETKGILGISKDIILIQHQNEIKNLPPYPSKLAFTTQTTMGYLDVLHLAEQLKEVYPTIEIHIDICNATKLRQEALLASADLVDFIIIVGDPASNNTKKLKEVCDIYTATPSILVQNITDLKAVDLSLFSTVGVTAGASTPTAIVDEIISGITNNDFNSYLQPNDYLNYTNKKTEIR